MIKISPKSIEGLPSRVTIYEVGPRDGLQNEAHSVSTETKVEFIERLVDAGLSVVEATSFVPAKWIPQLADAGDVFDAVSQLKDVRLPVLVPNETGLDNAISHGVKEIAIFGSATESFARRNLNRTIDESLAMFAPVVARASKDGLLVRAYISMCFGDPWEGEVDPAQVVKVGRQLLDLGCYQLSIGDTIGVATPGKVVALLDSFTQSGVEVDQLAVHFHDTYGQALANTLVSLQYGITTVDSSAGGLGGCPYAQSATGNLATEDLLWQLDGLGIQTGVDLLKLVETSSWMAKKLGHSPTSRVVQALSDGG